MIRKTGFDNGICQECMYKKRGRCTKCDKFIENIKQCPENYTYDLMYEIADDYRRRTSGRPHSDLLAREW